MFEICMFGKVMKSSFEVDSPCNGLSHLHRKSMTKEHSGLPPSTDIYVKKETEISLNSSIEAAIVMTDLL